MGSGQQRQPARMTLRPSEAVNGFSLLQTNCVAQTKIEPWQLSSEHVGFGETGHCWASARRVVAVEAVVSVFSCVAFVMVAKAINPR